MSGLSVKSISKSFEDVSVLKDISFEAKEGEFTVLLGPSGCGKSTLLNIFAGLEDISNDGSIHLGGRDITFLTPKERNIAMVFQSYALYPNMTISQNIAFGLKNKKLSAEEMSERVLRVAKLLQIEDLLDRKPSELSGGQRQRVAMGRAISRSPALYLFDEPLSNLDAKLRVELRLELKLLHRREKKSIVYVTHDQIEAMTLADRIIILNKGDIMQNGTPQEIYYTPKNVFVATFIGSPPANILPAEVSAGPVLTIEDFSHSSDRSVENSADKPKPKKIGSAPIKESMLQKALTPYAGKEIVIGVRPEYIEIHAGSDTKLNAAEDRLTFPSVIKAVEFIGSEQYVYFEIRGKNIVAKCPCTEEFTADQAVTLSFDLKNAFFFDKESEKSIVV